MLSLEDCLALCELTEVEVLAIAEHEHIPEIAAAELGNYLVHTRDGEMRIKAILREDIERALERGEPEHAAQLRLALRDFVREHPDCDERHREVLEALERRVP